MNILLISVVFPFPIEDGGKVGTHKMIENLRDKHQITLLVPESRPENMRELKRLWPNVNIVTFANPPCDAKEHIVKKILKSIRGNKKPTKEQLFKQSMLLQTTDMVNLHFADFLKVLLEITSNNDFDLIQVEFIDLAPVIHFLPEKPKKVFVHHEIRHRRMRLEYQTLHNHSKEDLWRIENIQVLEIGLLNKYHKVICLTEIDKEFLREDGVIESKLEVSPLPVVISEHPVNRPFVFQNKLVFLGPEVHFPNLDAVDWFLTNCWEKLQKIFPDLVFEIVGKWNEKTIESYQNYKNVKFMGFVDDLSEVMTGAIMVVPLRIGSGMRMKILEGVSWHVPVVSTPVGAEGLPMFHGQNCFLSTTPFDFVASIEALANDTDLQNKFIEGSRELIKSGFSIEDCIQKRENIFNSIV
jgi:glycosyltransferase involved in cell wall biosynthesis